MTRYLTVLALLVLCVWTPAAAAGETRPPEAAVTTMDEVVVTATRTEEQRRDVPNAVIVLDAADIAESPATSLGDFLSNELGLDWRTYGNYGGAAETINIRGLGPSGTQVRVNGVAVNSPSLGSADVGRIPLNSIARIEVVKGSGSVLYGSGAVGGVIDITTKSPVRDVVDIAAAAGIGSRRTSRLEAEQGMYVFGDFGYYLTAGYTETDGFRNNADLQHADASLKLVYDPSRWLKASLYGDYIEREYGLPGVNPPDGTGTFTFDGIDLYDDDSASLLNEGSDEDYHLVLQLGSDPLDWLGLHLQADYTDMENYFYSRYYTTWPVAGIPGGEYWTTTRTGGLLGYLDLHPLEGLTVLAGGEYKDYDWKNRSYALDGDGGRVAGSTVTVREDIDTTGLFSEVQYRPCRYFKLLAGIRHEDHSEFGDKTLPRFGAVFNLFEDTTLKASHGRHFIAPTPNDLFYPDDGFSRGNPDLEPEVGWHTDVTVEQSLLDDRLFLSAGYFHWDLDDKIQWGPNSQGVWEPVNLREYEADGLELGARIGPFYDLTLALNYTYTDAEEENKAYTVQDYGFPPFFPPNFQYDWVKRRAAFTPKDQFKANLTWRSDFGLTAQLIGRFVGSRCWYRTETTVYPDTETVRYKLEKYWTADVKLEQRLYDHWLLSFEATNIFDKHYDTYYGTFTNQESGVTTVEPYPGAGTTVFFKLRYEY